MTLTYLGDDYKANYACFPVCYFVCLSVHLSGQCMPHSVSKGDHSNTEILPALLHILLLTLKKPQLEDIKSLGLQNFKRRY